MPRLCINPATTMTTDFATDLRAFAAAGFRATELWLTKLDRYLDDGHSLAEARGLLDDSGLAPLAACAQGNLLISVGEERGDALENLRRRAELLATLGCPLLIVPSEALPQPLPRPVQPLYVRAAENLAEAADLVAPFGITLAVEFIKGPRVAGTPLTAQELVARCERPNASVLFDTFHFYAGYGKIEDLAALDVARLGFVHVNDAPATIPREALTDSDRVFPGEGDIPLGTILAQLQGRGYRGAYSLEIFNQDVWAEDPFLAARRAYASMVNLLGTEDG